MDSDSGDLKRLFRVYPATLEGSVACSADGKFVAAADDTSVRVWDREDTTDFVIGERKPSETGVLAVAPDGGEIISGGNHDGYVWQLKNSLSTYALPGSGGEERVSAASYSPTGDTLVTGDFGGFLRLWRRKTGERWQEQTEIKAHQYSVSAIAVSGTGLIASIDDIDGSISLRTVDDSSFVNQWTLKDSGISQVFSFFFNDGSSTLHVSGRNGGVNSSSVADPDSIIGLSGIEVKNGKPRPHLWTPKEGFIAAASDPGEHLAALASENGWISLLEYDNGAPIARLVPGRNSSILSIDEENRFDTTDISDLSTAYWRFSDTPLQLYSLELTMRDYYEPNLVPRLVACRAQQASKLNERACGDAFTPVRSLAYLNRVPPSLKDLEREAGFISRRSIGRGGGFRWARPDAEERQDADGSL